MPLPQRKNTSISVHATRQFIDRFGCGVSGDVFSFVQKIENVTFPEAVRAVAQKFGIALPKLSYSSPGEAEEAKLRTVLEIHERAVSFFQECLRRPEGARAREYLAGRGLTQDVINAFRICYAPDSGFFFKDRLKGEFDADVLRKSGLFSWKERSQLTTGQSSAKPISLDFARDDKEDDKERENHNRTAATRARGPKTEDLKPASPTSIPNFATG